MSALKQAKSIRVSTGYRLGTNGNSVRVYDEKEKILCYGFNDEESAMHAIWTIEGKPEDKYFVVENGFVYEEQLLEE